MIDIQYSNSITELLYYLKGIDEQDIAKIPNKLMSFWKKNKNNDYLCSFDYTKPLEELQYELSEDTMGLIGMICYNYWCENEEEKEQFLKQLEKNEIKYQEEIIEKYDWQRNLRRNKKEENNENYSEPVALIELKNEKFIIKILNKFKTVIKHLFEKK